MLAPLRAGAVLASAQVVALIMSLLAPIVAGRFADQRVVTLSVITVCAVGFVLLWFLPNLTLSSQSPAARLAAAQSGAEATGLAPEPRTASADEALAEVDLADLDPSDDTPRPGGHAEHSSGVVADETLASAPRHGEDEGARG